MLNVCPTCGYQLLAGSSAFCPVCGHPLSDMTEQQSPQTASSAHLAIPRDAGMSAVAVATSASAHVSASTVVQTAAPMACNVLATIGVVVVGIGAFSSNVFNLYLLIHYVYLAFYFSFLSFVVIGAFWYALLRLNASNRWRIFSQSFALGICIVVMGIFITMSLNRYFYYNGLKFLNFYGYRLVYGLIPIFVATLVGYSLALAFARWRTLQEARNSGTFKDALKVIGVLSLSICVEYALRYGVSTPTYSVGIRAFDYFPLLLYMALPFIARYDALRELRKLVPALAKATGLPLSQASAGASNLLVSYATIPPTGQKVYSRGLAITNSVLFSVAAISVLIPSYTYSGMLTSALNTQTQDIQFAILLYSILIVLCGLGGLTAAIIATAKLQQATDPLRLLRGFAGVSLGAAIIGICAGSYLYIRFIDFVDVLNRLSAYYGLSHVSIGPGVTITIGLFVTCGLIAIAQFVQLDKP